MSDIPLHVNTVCLQRVTLPYLTLPSGWAGCYTCPALRPYQFGPVRNPDVTIRSQWSANRLWSWKITSHLGLL